MGDTLSEIDAGLKLFNEVLPTAAGIASAVDPALAPILGPAQLLLAAIGNELNIATQDEGKPFAQIVNDLIAGFPGQQAAAAAAAQPATT